MSSPSLTIEQVLTLLAEAPSRIAALTADLSPAQLRTTPAPDEWSPNDVLAHLRSCADVWGSGIRTIIAEDRPTLRAINPRAWIKHTDYPDLEFRPSLQAFATQRTELLAVLEALPPADWSRAATVTRAGKPREQTVLAYTQRLADHEQPHIEQIARIVNAIRVEQAPPKAAS